MEKKKGISAELIIIIIIAIVIIGVIIYFNLNKEAPIEFGIVEGTTHTENTFIEDYPAYVRFASKVGLDDTITINFKKYSIKERYNEEFFETKKLAVVVLGEDTSRNYIHDISDIIYNKEKTEVTIKYVYKSDGYAGTYSKTWQTCMVVELDKNVSNVKFELDNSASVIE